MRQSISCRIVVHPYAKLHRLRARIRNIQSQSAVTRPIPRLMWRERDVRPLRREELNLERVRRSVWIDLRLICPNDLRARAIEQDCHQRLLSDCQKT